ncbi:hypothetical protein PRIPAC_85257, partial [Pristionchus pacificus]|uniref:AD domain-containing protein n=1 Tax=Pristionchus pacificus TaxID=54126 RepID=A0A8R1Z2L4_PRIPA
LEMSLLESLSIEEMINLQGHPVIIKCIQGGRSGTKFEGNLFTIDPISRNVIIIRFDDKSENPLEMLTIMGNSIESMDKCIDLPSNCRPFSLDLMNWMNSLVGQGDPSQTDSNSEENMKRLQQLVEWLKKNYISVIEKPDGSLLIFDTVQISAPFRPSDCICDNGIVLERVRNIVQKANLS